mmetsp:Transcript_24347/g.73119  ORF Transcript_24347/g.73119 Transcript_24347/m.73119 type:complete len:548 (-) Transcript_24347:1121-2764(-)
MAAALKMWNTVFQPDLMDFFLFSTIQAVMFTTCSLTLRLTPPLLVMMSSNGWRNSAWNWKFASSSFSKNFAVNCRKESRPYMPTSLFLWQTTSTKCMASTRHIFCHSSRARCMLKLATSTSFCNEKMRGWSVKASSSFETLANCVTKCTMAPCFRDGVLPNTCSICALLICETIDSEFNCSTFRSSAPRATRAETPKPCARRLTTSLPRVPIVLVLRGACAGEWCAAGSSSWPKNAKSCLVRLPISSILWRCEMHISTYSHDGPRLLPSDKPMVNNALMQSMFFCFISFTVANNVNFAKDWTKASRSVSMSKRAATRMQCLKPSMHNSTVLAVSSDISSSTANVARYEHQATSNSGRTWSAHCAVTYVWLLDSFFLRISVARCVMLSVSRTNNSCFWWAFCAACVSNRDLASSSSFSEIGLVSTLSYSRSRESRGKSWLSLMPRLLLTNWSLVILFLTPGLCRSVCNMISANDRTKAQSAFANVSGLSWQYFSANFSIMRSIFCASPGSLKIDKKRRRESSSSSLLKSWLSTSAHKMALLNGLSSPR